MLIFKRLNLVFVHLIFSVKQRSTTSKCSMIVAHNGSQITAYVCKKSKLKK